MRNPFRRDTPGQTTDPGVLTALEAVGYSYRVGDSGSCFVTIVYSDAGRTQEVEIESATTAGYGGECVRRPMR